MNERHACINMIKQQLRTGNVFSDRIIELYRKIHRHEFVPEEFMHFAYVDMHIPLPYGQCMFTPLEEASLLEALQLTGTETVLEVGTGSGFFTALLASLAKQVTSIDYFEYFTNLARKNLSDFTNVELVTGDGCRGFIERAPYDVIIFTGARNRVYDIERLQILPGGRLFTITGANEPMMGMLHKLNKHNKWSLRPVFETGLPMLIDKLDTEKFVF